MSAPSVENGAAVTNLQEAIDRAGSPMNLLWKPGSPPWQPPVLSPEYAGWRQEQRAAIDAIALSDLSYHMRDLFISGPDAVRLLADFSANNYEKFEIGQAKQFIPVTERGLLVTDGILLRTGHDSFTLTGVDAAQNWVIYHAEQGGYNVEFEDDPEKTFHPGDPVLCRYQVQGPAALQLVDKVFGAGQVDVPRFFHSSEVEWNGRRYRALRHGMAGQPGYEFIGSYADGEPLKQALIDAGQEFGLIQIGAKAYSTNGIESGWIPTPTPAIYSDAALESYRRWLRVFTYEGQVPLQGTFFSEDVEDYYVSPWELGYGRSISLGHDFLGRDALERTRDQVRRVRATVVVDPAEVRRVFGDDLDFFLSYARYRVEAGGRPAGMTFYTGNMATAGTILALSLIDQEFAEPGTEVELVYGSHPGPGNDPHGEFGFERLRATVQVSPYSEFAREGYRKS
jgi:vanillate/3-O-methylgallate O-demethylase